VSNLLHGHIRRFNSETLIDILARLGVTVEVVVAKRQR
jgi:predicted XRE-type DNA-binding protein